MRAHVRRFSCGGVDDVEDDVVEEVPVALIYNGLSHAVMMATPTDLEEFAFGFSLSEGIVDDQAGILGIEVLTAAFGVEVKIDISQRYMHRLRQRRRQLAGKSGCGVCGIEALNQMLVPISKVVPVDLEDSAVHASLAQLPDFQPLRRQTGASHAAAFCSASGDIRFAFEDVGRHNALDKMLGHWARSPEHGFALVSSRASYEMVYKVCRLGIGALLAVSAPTSMAIELAQQSGLNLIGFARPGRYQQYLSIG